MAAITDKVDNYPGFPEGIEGMTLATQLEKQAERFGAHIDFGDVSAIRSDGRYKVATVDGQDVKAKAVLIATGSDYKKLGVPGVNGGCQGAGASADHNDVSNIIFHKASCIVLLILMTWQVVQ